MRETSLAQSPPTALDFETPCTPVGHSDIKSTVVSLIGVAGSAGEEKMQARWANGVLTMGSGF